MADIPVERTTGTPWWLWLLGALLLGLLLWFLIGLFGENEDDFAETPVEMVEPVPTARPMDLSNVFVTRVVGDNTFFVAPEEGSGEEMLVYLEEEATPGQATEGRYDVTPGQHIRIDGAFRPLTGANVAQWGLSDAEASGLDRDGDYIRATSLTVLGGDAMSGDAMNGDGMNGDGMNGDGGAIGSLSALDQLLASPTDALDGRAVDLSGVTVSALAGDSTFYIGEGANRVLVILAGLGESETGPGDGSDGAFDVNVGQRLDLDGTLMRFRRGQRGTADLSAADQAEAERRRFVIAVRDRSDLSMR